jgi:hypothetical protein
MSQLGFGNYTSQRYHDTGGSHDPLTRLLWLR